MFLGLYAGVMFVVTALTNRDQIGSALVSIAIGVVVAGSFLVLLSKFGYTLPILRSRQEIAEQRARRLAARAARSGGGGGGSAAPVAGPRPKAPPTRRTTTGPSQHPRRTSSARRK